MDKNDQGSDSEIINLETIIPNKKKAKKYKALFFDAGNTLFHVYPSVGIVYAEAAGRFGNEVSSEEIDRTFMKHWEEWSHIHSFPVGKSLQEEYQWWYGLVDRLMEPLGPIKQFDDFFKYLHELFKKAEVWRLFPEVIGVLDYCKNHDMVLGIISNWDSRLVAICEAVGIADKFDFILSSSQAGVSKPDAAIFEMAINKAGIKASEALHIGDSIHDDINGARQAGLDALWINRTKSKTGNDKIAMTDTLKSVLSLC